LRGLEGAERLRGRREKGVSNKNPLETTCSSDTYSELGVLKRRISKLWGMQKPAS